MDQIGGLILIENFITNEQEKDLLEFIDSPNNSWNTKLSRRTMHFGYEYSYNQNGSLTESNPIPKEFDWLINLISSKLDIKEQPINQIIINEYLPGQGISPHIDSNSFGDIIVSLSLGSPCYYGIY